MKIMLMTVSRYQVIACTFSTLQVSRLETTPGLRTLANLPVINGLITSFLPSVILRIFLKLLPNLLGFMSHVQGMTSLSQVDFGVLRKYFIFQVYMLLVLFHALSQNVRQMQGNLSQRCLSRVCRTEP